VLAGVTRLEERLEWRRKDQQRLAEREQDRPGQQDPRSRDRVRMAGQERGREQDAGHGRDDLEPVCRDVHERRVGIEPRVDDPPGEIDQREDEEDEGQPSARAASFLHPGSLAARRRHVKRP